MSFANFTFDPLGIVNPSLLKAKLIIRELRKGNTGWRTERPNYLKQTWDNWKNSLDEIEKIEIPR